ncbi:MAG: asparagine synthase (glutamine-hydrolyzing) [Paracoccaceae bacterium]
MCGICGWYGKNAGSAVDSMLPQLEHRGPDSSSSWSEGCVALGHTRLSILDLSSAGNQPFYHPSGQVVGIVNGEIYNYPELRKKLELEGAKFKSNSDSEVVIHAYLHWGLDSFALFNGMFAVALYDRRDRSLILVRDRLGIKPLYYCASEASFSFASEIKAILTSSEKKRWTIDADGLSQLLTYGNMFENKTLFEGVSLLNPGSYLIVDNKNRIRERKYWEISDASCNPIDSFEEGVNRFQQTFEKSVRRHLLSDVPIATYLSAGFDSSMVATQASLILDDPPTSYTGYFCHDGWYDESYGASLVAKKNSSLHVLVPITSEDFKDSFDNLLFALDEPRMGMGAFPQYMVAKKAAEKHRVILSGHGGDELFSGYPIFKLAFGLEQSRSSYLNAARFVSSIKISELPQMAYFITGKLSGGETSWGLPVLNSKNRQKSLLHSKVWDRIKASDPSLPLRYREKENANWSDLIFDVYIKQYLAGLLVVEDKISMANSLETRTPFLDNEMIDLSLNLKNSVKLNNYELKAVVKQSGKNFLPENLYRQPKRGFPTPLRYWLRGPLKSWVNQRLLGPDSRLTNIIQRSSIVALLDHYQSSWLGTIRSLDEIQTHRIWQLLCIESWLRQCETKLGVEILVDR